MIEMYKYWRKQGFSALYSLDSARYWIGRGWKMHSSGGFMWHPQVPWSR